jgi:hypothetical protein
MSITNDDRAYRRGIVLGFTVAEIVLLLVFCLLLLFVPILLTDAAQSDVALPLPTTAPSLKGGHVANDPPTGSAPVETMGAASRPPEPKPIPSKPLPDDWITATPNRPNESPVPIELSPPPVVAITLDSLCKRLGISEQECTVDRASATLVAAAPKPPGSAAVPNPAPTAKHNWPPIIRLKEADGEFFIVGKADVSKTLEEKVKRDVVPSVLELATRYQTNVIEVVGHTDEQPVQNSQTNLDATVFEVLTNRAPASRLRASDNAGLGFARAVAIVQILRADKRLEHLSILPLSAAQVVDQDGKLTDGMRYGDVKERRRIEIRVRQGEPPT